MDFRNKQELTTQTFPCLQDLFSQVNDGKIKSGTEVNAHLETLRQNCERQFKRNTIAVAAIKEVQAFFSKRYSIYNMVFNSDVTKHK